MSEADLAAKESVAVAPSGAALGAYVSGLDAGPGLSERGLMHIRDALLRHSVVILRDQTLTPDDQFAFMDRLYGMRPPLGIATPFAVGGHPEMQKISNITKHGKPIGINDAGLMWHTDTCSFPMPELFVSLYSLEIPFGEDGEALGNTRWTSAIAAYEALPEAIKQELAGKRVSQNYGFHIEQMRSRGILTRGKDIQKTDNMAQLHPAVRTHPITGRKLLYVNESYSEWLEGIEPERSRTLLEQLWAHLAEERFHFTHSWRKGDFVIWDNAATQHIGTFDYDPLPRLLHRCGSDGPVPE
ncbi:MAG: TauD/TfdA family dioxygenase [Novosphingobium sp.]|nr:TauD/TfdA family dioxygenase [Novosphingobium sp.]